MKSRILVVAPHPDDELLGCGGTLLRRKAEGAEIDCLIVTGITEADGWPADRVASRAKEIEKVGKLMGFRELTQLDLPTTQLDAQPLGAIVQRIGDKNHTSKPTEENVPSGSDVHSDHRVVFEAVAACAKWFRYP